MHIYLLNVRLSLDAVEQTEDGECPQAQDRQQGQGQDLQQLEPFLFVREKLVTAQSSCDHMEKPPKVKASPNGFEKITIRLFSVFVCFCSDHRSLTYSKQNDRFSTQICQPSFWASIYYRYAGRATGFWN